MILFDFENEKLDNNNDGVENFLLTMMIMTMGLKTLKIIMTMGSKTLTIIMMTMGLKVLREERADDQCETTADINALRNKVPAMLITMITMVMVVVIVTMMIFCMR